MVALRAFIIEDIDLHVELDITVSNSTRIHTYMHGGLVHPLKDTSMALDNACTFKHMDYFF